MLRRAGLLSEARAEKAIAWMRRHGSAVRRLHSSDSHGKRTARAAVRGLDGKSANAAAAAAAWTRWRAP